ncbi:MAG: class I SAM-dependent methyltransferase [Planctomycetes bacterium]|nr:class I SAM-dependent methyltransferase [Planctomycetota bacterium]
MIDRFTNVYDDKARADAYAKLEFPGTYYLAYRDLPAIISEHVNGTAALDFGCGTGRSTRFLHRLGFAPVLGVDIASHMVDQARELDPHGAYLLVPDDELSELPPGTFHLVLAVFTFDNIPTTEKKVALFTGLRNLLTAGGRIVSLVSSPDIYINKWSSFSTKDFPENRTASCGDKVRIVMLDVPDQRPVEDLLWTDEGYQEVFERAGVRPLKTYWPLANEAEPHDWVSELGTAPWIIYVLGRGE